MNIVLHNTSQNHKQNSYTEKDICVIVTSYNETLVEIIYCLKAILKNNIPIEAILLINDNPNKITRSNQIKKVFPGIYLINNKTNHGISHSRNIGIDYATKKSKCLIAFCDADDSWLDGKISLQLSYINSGYSLVSSGTFEVNYFMKLERLPNLNELEFGGNPIFLSSTLMKRPSQTYFKDLAVEDRLFFRELIENEYPVSQVKIIPKALISKFNYSGRRGANILDSQLQVSNSSYEKFRVLIYKIMSIKRIRISFLKLIIFEILSLFIIKKINTKRLALSINFRSSEYKNLAKFSRVYNIPLFLRMFFRLDWDRRNRPFCEANNLKKLIISVIYGKLLNVRFAYIGLSGARFIKEYVEIPSETKKIHVVHGRNIGDKFNTYADAALTQVIGTPGEVPAGKLWHFKAEKEYIYKDNVAIWFHGFNKGKSYGWKYFMSDLGFLFGLFKKYNTVMVAPHPLAHLLRIYLKYFTSSYYTFNIYEKNTIYCSSIYSSSPSISNSELKQYAAEQGIKFNSLADLSNWENV
jgi:hypothetical protein